MILVLGGTGFVGSFMLLELTQHEQPVRAIYRTDSALQETKKFFLTKGRGESFDAIDWIQLTSIDVLSLEQAFAGVTAVFHAAGKVSFNDSDAKELRKSNYILTREVVNACIAYGVQKLIYFGSIAVLNNSKKNIAKSEKTEWSPEVRSSFYAKTKWQAELEVWRGQEEGLQVAVLLPSVILGWKNGKSPSEAIFTYALGRKPKSTAGGTAFVDVRDIARCSRLIYEKELFGERYILSSENVLYRDFFDRIRAVKGLPKTDTISTRSLRVIEWFGWVLPLFGKRKISAKQIRSWSNVSTYNSDKVKKALNYNFRNIDTIIDETLEEIS